MDFTSLTAPSTPLRMTNKAKKCYSENRQHCAFYNIHYRKRKWQEQAGCHHASSMQAQEIKWPTALSLCNFSIHCAMEACPDADLSASIMSPWITLAIMQWAGMKTWKMILISIPECTEQLNTRLHRVSSKWARAETLTWLQSFSLPVIPRPSLLDSHLPTSLYMTGRELPSFSRISRTLAPLSINTG